MVQLAHGLLYPTGTEPMVDGAAEEHQEHSYNKKDNAHGHLPALLYGRPDNPHRGEGENSPYEVCPSISFFSVTHIFNDNVNVNDNLFRCSNNLFNPLTF